MTSLPRSDQAVVDGADNALIFGGWGTEQIDPRGAGNLEFITSAGSGTITAGGGGNVIVIGGAAIGPWANHP